MDLYSAGLSVSQGDNLSAQVQQANDSAQDFNNSLAEQLDTAKNEAEGTAAEGQLLSLTKNAPVGAKLLANPITAGALKSVGKAFTKAPLTAAKGFFTKVPAVAEVAPAAVEAAPAVENVIGTSATAVLPVAEEVGEEAAEVGAKAAGKSLLAGAGAAIEIGKDIQRGSFGSNWEQKLGGVAGIAGSALEVAGALTAWTGFGVGVEAAGIGLSLAGGGLEGVGDAKQSTVTKGKAEDDVISQTRSITAAQAPTIVAARSN